VDDGKQQQSTDTIRSGVPDGKGNNDSVRIGGQERDGLFGDPAQVPSGQNEKIEEMLS
jgi:hypothetical protein